MSRQRLVLIVTVCLGALVVCATAQAAVRVTPARGATRRSLLHAFVAQDGSSLGVSGVFAAGSRPALGVVCQHTPDGARARFIFRASGRGWHYLLSTTGTRAGTSTERALERACR